MIFLPDISYSGVEQRTTRTHQGKIIYQKTFLSGFVGNAIFALTGIPESALLLEFEFVGKNDFSDTRVTAGTSEISSWETTVYLVQNLSLEGIDFWLTVRYTKT